VESSSLSPPASAVSIASHCSSSSPSPSPPSSAFSTVHVVCEQWRATHNWPPPFPPPATPLPLPLPLPLLLRLLHSPLFMLHVNSGEQRTTGLRRFHRQPLLFLFPFPFPFSSVSAFSTVHVACEQSRAAHNWPPPFPPPATALPLPLPLPLLLLLRLLHSPLFTLHVNSGEQRTTGLRRFHRQPLLFLFPFPFPFPFSISFSFVFCILHYSREHWRASPLFIAGPGPTKI